MHAAENRKIRSTRRTPPLLPGTYDVRVESPAQTAVTGAGNVGSHPQCRVVRDALPHKLLQHKLPVCVCVRVCMLVYGQCSQAGGYG